MAFSTLLIANRGEIACRIARSARRLGYRTVAVYSEADRGALHVETADVAVCVGAAAPSASYLNIPALIEAARRTGADAIHPGYGFLAENADFARACADAGIRFVGPSPEAIDAMGNKRAARRRMAAVGVPCVPGYDEGSQDESVLIAAAGKIGYPLMVKAAAGGGGRGLRRVLEPAALPAALAAARAEAQSAFGSGELILERAVEGARHVEVQVFGDTHGHIIHLGERDCSAQRRNQKVLEESPSPAVDAALRARMGETAVAAACAIGYVGAGTVEMLLAADGSYYFLEMNTRLQVEHPVTEFVTGLDLVDWQLRIAAGEPLPLSQDQVQLRGHAIEARLYAEDPDANYAPQTGPILCWRAPAADPRYALPELHGELASVTISVAKKQNTNAVVVAREVLDLVARMQARFVPSDVVVVTTRNDGVEANHTVNKLIFDLAIAIGAVLLVLVPILGLRQALIVCLVVPLVLSLTLAVDMVAGVTVNRISLFALILALGMLVDDAIVVMENIHRHYEEGVQDRRRAAVLATHEIGKPTTTATITIVLVFSSLQLLTGMNGAYFAPISFNVTLAIAFSLLVAYTVVPWACVRWLPHQHTAEAPAHSAGGGALQRRYQRLVDPLIRSAGRRRWAVCGVLAALLASMLMPSWQFLRPGGPGGPVSAGGVALSIMPKEDKNTFAITLDLPEDAAVELTDRVAREFGEVIGRHPQVSNYLTYVGLPGVADFSALVSGDSQRGDPNQAEIRVNLIDKSLRHKTSMQIVEELREATAPIRARYPRMDVRFMEAPPGPPNRAVVLANIHGEDENTLRELSAAVKERFRQTWGMVDVFDSMPVDSEQIDLVVDKEKALLSGVTTADVEQTLRAVMDGMVVSQAHVPGERNPVPIRLRVPRELEVDPQRLDRVLVRNAQGQTVPLSELVQAVLRPRENPILRKDDERVTYVGGNVAAATAPAFVIMDMERHLDGLPVAGTPLRTGNLTLLGQVPDTIDGYELLWDGEMRLTLDAAREMGAINGVVLVLIYLLMVGVYRSFSLPLMAMTAIPFGLIGIFPGHWLLGIPFSMASMIGVVALAGVVIRNSLLIIDFVHDYQRRGHSLEEAVKLSGGVRLRPIALTASTVILGTLVLYRDPMFAGLATSLISGTIASTVLTLLLLPPLYYRMALNHPEWARGI